METTDEKKPKKRRWIPRGVDRLGIGLLVVLALVVVWTIHSGGESSGARPGRPRSWLDRLRGVLHRMDELDRLTDEGLGKLRGQDDIDLALIAGMSKVASEQATSIGKLKDLLPEADHRDVPSRSAGGSGIPAEVGTLIACRGGCGRSSGRQVGVGASPNAPNVLPKSVTARNSA